MFRLICFRVASRFYAVTFYNMSNDDVKHFHIFSDRKQEKIKRNIFCPLRDKIFLLHCVELSFYRNSICQFYLRRRQILAREYVSEQKN